MDEFIDPNDIAEEHNDEYIDPSDIVDEQPSGPTVRMFDDNGNESQVPESGVNDALDNGLFTQKGYNLRQPAVSTGKAATEGFFDAFPDALLGLGDRMEAAVPTDSFIRKIGLGDSKFTDNPELEGMDYDERLAYITKSEDDEIERIKTTNPNAFNTGKAAGVVTQVASVPGVARTASVATMGALRGLGNLASRGVKAAKAVPESIKTAGAMTGAYHLYNNGKKMVEDTAAAIPFAAAAGVEAIANIPEKIGDWMGGDDQEDKKEPKYMLPSDVQSYVTPELQDKKFGAIVNVLNQSSPEFRKKAREDKE